MKRDRRRQGIVSVLVLLAVLLAACGGDGDQEVRPPSPAPTLTPEPSPIPTEWPAQAPYTPPATEEFAQASEEASVALATDLAVPAEEVTVLEPEAVLILGEPQECPDLPEDATDVYYLYAQHAEKIYAYQVRPSSAEDVGLLIERCEDVLIDPEVLYIPEQNPLAAPVDAVRADLEGRGVDPLAGAFSTVTEVLWTDEALGCPYGAGILQPGAAAIEGYLIVYVLGGQRYEYHTDREGALVIYCAAPPGYESVERFVEALQTQFPDIEIAPVPPEDGAAVYDGLDAEGLLLALTDDAYRIGVFGFATAEEARAAAQAITSGGVSHLFVAGNVLIVQEENSLLVYSLLGQIAEEVRNVAEEQQIADLQATPEE